MEIITEPRVEVISVPEFLELEDRPVPLDGDVPTRLGAFAAKGCYGTHGREGRASEKNQKAILDHKHGSVLEHINIGVWIEGITRALSLELNRHRHFAISQRSTRYTDEEDAAIVLEPYFAELYKRWEGHWNIGDPVPDDLEEGHKPMDEVHPDNKSYWNSYFALRSHLWASEYALDEYGRQVRYLMKANPKGLEGRDLRKWARGKARNCLPHNLETKGTWTTNIRSWRWILEARGSRHAADEIRRLSFHLFDALYNVAPLYFEDFDVTSESGVLELVPEHKKV